jgi:hypothetical protein
MTKWGLFLTWRPFGAHLVRLGHVKAMNCFDVCDVRGYGSKMQKTSFLRFLALHTFAAALAFY